jgi:hypothetical protein
MSDEAENTEAAEETIEDLEAPAEASGSVAGGGCQKFTQVNCLPGSCVDTVLECATASIGGVLHGR